MTVLDAVFLSLLICQSPSVSLPLSLSLSVSLRLSLCVSLCLSLCLSPFLSPLSLFHPVLKKCPALRWVVILPEAEWFCVLSEITPQLNSGAWMLTQADWFGSPSTAPPTSRWHYFLALWVLQASREPVELGHLAAPFCRAQHGGIPGALGYPGETGMS